MARQIPRIPLAFLLSEPMSVRRSIETPNVCGETERVQKTGGTERPQKS